MIPNEFIRGLIERTDIVELIRRDFELKKAGANFNACCPFHHEKSPSFTVSQSKQFFHCFGCGEHGTALTYLMKKRGLEYVPAIYALAEYNGVEVPEVAGVSKEKRDEYISLYKILDNTANFYQKLLQNNLQAQNYLTSRKIFPETIAKFRLGLSPDSFDGIKKYFSGSGFIEGVGESLEELLIRAGLLIVREDSTEEKANLNKSYDRFRNRLMVPIINKKGQVIGFGGRTFGDEQPKYLNSPETEVFHKGRELFGFYQAQDSIRKTQSVIVVEGYFDVISLAQAGIENVVASMGTAITPEQINQLWQVSEKIILCFDGDSAGEKATYRAIERILPVIRDGKIVEIVRLPAGKDPDNLVQENGLEYSREFLTNGQKLSDFLFAVLKNDYDASSEGKAQLVRRAGLWITAISGNLAPILKNDLIAKIAGLVNLPVATVLSGIPINQSARNARNQVFAGERGGSQKWLSQNKNPLIERTLLREALNHPDDIREIISGVINHENEYSQCLYAIADAYENGDLPHSFAGRITFLQEKGYEKLMAAQMAEIMANKAGKTEKPQEDDINFRIKNAEVKVSNREIRDRFTELCDKNKIAGLSDEEKKELNRLLPLLKTNQIVDNDLIKK